MCSPWHRIGQQSLSIQALHPGSRGPASQRHMRGCTGDLAVPCTSLMHRGNSCFPNDLKQLHSLPRRMEGRGLGLPGARWAVETWCSSPYPLGSPDSFLTQFLSSVHSHPCPGPASALPSHGAPTPLSRGLRHRLRGGLPKPSPAPHLLPSPQCTPSATAWRTTWGHRWVSVTHPHPEGGGFQDKGRGQLIYPKTSGEDAGQELWGRGGRARGMGCCPWC